MLPGVLFPVTVELALLSYNTGNIETQGTGTYVIRKDENTSVEKNALEDFRRCSQQKQHAKTLIAMLLTTNRLE